MSILFVQCVDCNRMVRNCHAHAYTLPFAKGFYHVCLSCEDKSAMKRKLGETAFRAVMQMAERHKEINYE